MKLHRLLLSLALTAPLFGQREIINLASGWDFIRLDVGLAAEPDRTWTSVTVPHTWNALDGQDGKAAQPDLPDGYYRGAAWYQVKLPMPADLGERRVFVRCQAVSQVADLYLNANHLGQHRGAFTAFAFDVTAGLRRDGANILRIRADNSRFPDVAPLTGDFSFFGGIYRPVQLFVVDPVHFSLADHGSLGVYLTTRRLAASEAEVSVRSLVTNSYATAAEIEVESSITDASGRVVATERRPVQIAPGTTLPVEHVLCIAEPHRWHGRRDPYLYRATVRLYRQGRLVDNVEQPLGLRTVAIDQQRGFLLNGEPYPIHGVSRHQDRLNRGWALTPADDEEDFRIIAEMGATAVRLPTYPQNDTVHTTADRLGLLLWDEIPNIERVPSLPEFAPALREQLIEMILQHGNHPSVAFWSLFNEAKAIWLPPFGAPPEPLLNELRTLVEQLDPSRLIVGASWLRDHDTLHDTVPYIAFNQYPGWKYATPDDMAPIVQQMFAGNGNRRIALSEYGAGASIFHHVETGLAQPARTDGPFHPEEWQAVVHEHNWRQLRDNPRIWGTFVWVMFDFAADQRSEGDTPGRNDKGLVTYDRRTRKDSYYFYQANWTTAPMAYITSRRIERRRVNPIPEVKVYSNCAEVELRVNGVSLGKVKPDEIAVCRWPNVSLQPGANRIEAIARSADGGETRDACSWFSEAKP